MAEMQECTRIDCRMFRHEEGFVHDQPEPTDAPIDHYAIAAKLLRPEHPWVGPHHQQVAEAQVHAILALTQAVNGSGRREIRRASQVSGMYA